MQVVLDSAQRSCDDDKITEAHLRSLAAWTPRARRSEEVPRIAAA
jgi:aconitate hydratase